MSAIWKSLLPELLAYEPDDRATASRAIQIFRGEVTTSADGEAEGGMDGDAMAPYTPFQASSQAGSSADPILIADAPATPASEKTKKKSIMGHLSLGGRLSSPSLWKFSPSTPSS
mgnify:CR=1 FL=1